MDIIKGIKKAAKYTLKKGKELGQVVKLKYEINDLNDSISNKKIEIGDIVMNEKLCKDNSDIKKIISDISKLENQIKEKEKEIKDIEAKS